MNLTFQLRIDFSPGPIPGQLKATVRMLTLDGHIIGDPQTYPVAVGQSFTLRPLSTSVVASAEVGVTPAAAPGLTAGQAAAALGAAGS